MGRSLAGLWLGPLLQARFPTLFDPSVGSPFIPPHLPRFPQVPAHPAPRVRTLIGKERGWESPCGPSVAVGWVLAAFLEGSGCSYYRNRPHGDRNDRRTDNVPMAVFSAKFTSIVFCLGESCPVIDLFRAHHWKKNPGDKDYLLLALSRHRPNSSLSPAPRGDEEGKGPAGGRAKLLPSDGARGRRPPHPSLSAPGWGERTRRVSFSTKPHASLKRF